jgi:5'-nucleotidase/UDP-sugar diphosphatase
MKPSCLGAMMMAFLICTSLPAVASFDLKILHINDHHSHLDGAYFTMDTSSLIGGVAKAKIGYGGFPRIVTLVKDLAQQAAPNVLKLHAGDAITGTLWHTMFKGKADAEMMGKVCFDAFTLGNHEFDDGDDGLANFLQDLAETGCGTKVLSANLQPGVSSPLAEGNPNQPMKYHVFEVGPSKEKVGVIGITTKQPTEESSYPGRVGGRGNTQNVGTVLLDEVTTAQTYINRLQTMDVNKIVLLTHVGYEKDLNFAAQLSGVDVIVGGHSHSLLGDATELLVAPNALPLASYPTETVDKDGKKVCIVQAWQYSRVVGNLDVTFSPSGEVISCTGGPMIPLAETSSWASASNGVLLGADNAAKVTFAFYSFLLVNVGSFLQASSDILILYIHADACSAKLPSESAFL